MTIRVLLRSSFSVRRPTEILLNRMFATSSSGGNIDTPSLSLLTLATAKQLKGDIPEAIDLASRALTEQRGEDNLLAVAETTLFLGKLFQLERRYDKAETFFDEAHSLHRSLAPPPPFGLPSRNEYVAQAHLGGAQKQLRRYGDAEKNYLVALRGLEEVAGWKDGFTNHTSFELARLYREWGREEDAAEVLRRMKRELAEVFGLEDARVLQINGELAEICVAIGDRRAAMSLLDEIVERLPPNIPEARRAFVRLEELKEEEEEGEVGGGVAVTKVIVKKK